jgi:hypothetical protein
MPLTVEDRLEAVVKVVINACSLRDIDQSGVQTAQRSETNSPGLQAWDSTPAEMRPERAPHLRSPKIGLFQEAVIKTASVAPTGQFSFLF